MSDLKYSFLQKRLKLTPVRLIVISYLLATFVAMILLSLPVSLKEGVKLSFVDTMFTSVSAISVTGLTVVSIVDTFSVFGVFMLMIVMQFGNRLNDTWDIHLCYVGEKCWPNTS